MAANPLVDRLLCVDGNSNGDTSSSTSDSHSDAEVIPEKPTQSSISFTWAELWKMRGKNDYTWCCLITAFYVLAVSAAAALVNAVGEAVVGKALLVISLAVALIIFGLAFFRPQPKRVNTGSDQLSSSWRFIYNGLCITLAILLFYTMGLSYLISSFLWHTGLLSSEPNMLWTIFFPMGCSTASIPPSSDAELLQIGKGVMGDALLFTVLCLILEPFICCKILPENEREAFSLGDSFLSVMTQVLPFYVNLAVFEYTQPLYAYIFDNWRLTDTFASETSVVGFWMCVIFADLWYYVVHRAAHITSWIWTSHMVHHSCEKFNLFNGPRGGTLLIQYTPWMLFDTIPLALFFPWQVNLCVAPLKWSWQFWIHATLPGQWPCLEWILFSPSLHRVHHLKHEDRLGKNYGCILSIWDHMFGTYEPEFRNENDRREDNFYGVIPALHTWDVVWLQLQPWYDIFGRQTKFNGPLAFLLHWTPPDSKCPKLGSRLNPREEYQEYPMSKVWTYYILQEVLVLIIFGAAGGSSSTTDTGRRLGAFDGHSGASAQPPSWLLLSASMSQGVSGHSDRQFVWTWACGLLGMWSCACLGWMLKGESRNIWNVEVLRKVVIVSCLAGYMTYYAITDTSRWLGLSAYSVLQIVLLFALWSKLPREDRKPGELI